MTQVFADLFAPLACFYTAAGTSAPAPQIIDGAAMPEPYRSLLVNHGDMTPTLEQFHACTLHLRVLGCTQVKDDYRRQVLLLNDKDSPVEFGAIRIHLDALPLIARTQVLAGQRPLGGILIEHGIPHSSKPSAYFTIIGDAVINHTLGMTPSSQLYGRCNTLIANDRRLIADVVEIIPLIVSPSPGAPL